MLAPLVNRHWAQAGESQHAKLDALEAGHEPGHHLADLFPPAVLGTTSVYEIADVVGQQRPERRAVGGGPGRIEASHQGGAGGLHIPKLQFRLRHNAPVQVDVFIPPGLRADEVMELGKLAESQGIRGLWCYNYIADPDPFVHLGLLARETRRLRIGPVAISPFQMHPLLIANSLLTLNELSAGRAEIVIGGGGAVVTAMGITPVRKLRAVRECLEFLRAAAGSREQPVNYSGQLYTVRNYRAEWLTQAQPGLLVGANGPQMAALAARLADGMMMSDFTVPMVAEMARIAADARAAGDAVATNFRINNFFAWHVKTDRAQARDEARRHLVLRGILQPQYLLSFLSQEESDLVQQHMPVFWRAWREQTGVFPGIPDELIDRLIEGLTLTGDLSDIDRLIAELKRFAAAGLTEIALGLHDEPAEGIRQIGRYLIPALQ